MQTAAELGVARHGDCLRLTLQRPDRGNALSRALVDALETALAEARRAPPRLLVLQGEGRHFCTGFDLSDLDAETDDSLLARFVRVELMLQSLASAPFPTLAIAHGRVTGAGADLFCACAERWVQGDATFSFPGAGFGLVLGTARLADAVGSARAQDWVMTGAPIDTASARDAGLVTRQAGAGTAEDELARWLPALQRLDGPTHAAIHAASAVARRPRGAVGDYEDLARLVRSAARPGLKERIAAYRAATARVR